MRQCRLCGFEFHEDDCAFVFHDDSCVCVHCHRTATHTEKQMDERLRRRIESDLAEIDRLKDL